VSAFPRPIVVVSQCLELAPCRHDGGLIPFSFIRRLQPHARLIPVCPEVEIGLGIPREPIRVIRRGRREYLETTRTGARLTAQMRAFSTQFLAALPAADGFILKSRSPSCGVRDTKIYASSGAGRPLGKGSGLFAARVLQTFGSLTVEDEARLARPVIRARFLTRLFTLAAFRRTKASTAPRALARFHAEYEPLLKAHSPREARQMAQLAQSASRSSLENLLPAYEARLRRALSRSPSTARRDQFPPPYPAELMEMDISG
jgi:uncharacterized protein YbbK (DUF523 family)